MAKNYKNKKTSGYKRDTRSGGKNEGTNINAKFADSQSANVNNDMYVRGSNHSNDIDWYNLNPQLLKDAASLNFSQIVGRSIPNPVANTTDPNHIMNQPGILRIGFEIGFGVSEYGTDAINSAAQLIYSKIRHENSGSRNYEAPDLMQYLLSMDSVYTYYSHLTRIHKVATLYNAKNNYYPKALLAALNVDADDLIGNLAQFRADLNARRNLILSRAVPNIMPLFKRHAWLASNVFTDSAFIDKAGLYVFAPDKLWKYVDKGNPVDGFAGFLTGVNVGPHYSIEEEGLVNQGVMWTAEELIAFLDEMINAVVGSEDAGIISGDITKVWGNDLWSLDFVNERDVLLPVYDDVVLHQIQNLTINGYSIGEDDIKQNVEQAALVYKPRFYTGNFNSDACKLLNVRQISPTPDAIMESTRGMTFGYVDLENKPNLPASYRYIQVCGADCFTAMTMFITLNDGSLIASDVPSVLDTSLESEQNILKTIGRLSRFDWHPFIYVVDGSNSSRPLLTIVGDYENITTVDLETLSKIHMTAMQSLVGLPVLKYGR